MHSKITAHREERKHQKNRLFTNTEKYCSKCDSWLPRKSFYPKPAHRSGLEAYCIPCTREYVNTTGSKRRRTARGVIKRMLSSAKSRAKESNLLFDLKESDILVPEFCPVLGTKMEIGAGRLNDNSPSLDRTIPEKGYVPGNVAVISHKANRMKSNGSLHDLELLVEYMKKYAQ